MISDPVTSRLWGMRVLYVVLSLIVIFLHFLPLDTLPRRWAPPDWLLMFTFAWALRRPDFVPTLSVGLVVLLADFLFHRPPGLWAAFMVLGTDYIKNHLHGLSDASFAGEWATVAIITISMTIGYRLALALFMVDAPPLGLVSIQAILTIVCYPLAVMAAAIIGVRKIQPGDAEALRGGRA